jgi:anhydro-N-acetylmuramic acid kinase
MRTKKTLQVIGVMSGTSCDGIACVLTKCHQIGDDVAIEVGKQKTYAYDFAIKNALLHAADLSSADLTSLNFYLGYIFGSAVQKFCQEEKIDFSTVDLIGSHGHTVVHRPKIWQNTALLENPIVELEQMLQTPGTMQIAEGACIASVTRIPVVCDFRCMDMAQGGQGAPLVPFFDWVAFRKKDKNRLLLNLGGIANLTLVTWEKEKTMGFDTGPANVLVDFMAREKIQQPCDRDGLLALQGNIDQNLLEQMLQDEYFFQPPPKSLDISYFSEKFLSIFGKKLLSMSVQDALATLSALTADSIFYAAKKFLSSPYSDLLVAGGGIYNQAIIKRLREKFSPIPVLNTQTEGIPSDSREAAAFALMAACHIWGFPNHIPLATGAKKASILGKFVPAI